MPKNITVSKHSGGRSGENSAADPVISFLGSDNAKMAVYLNYCGDPASDSRQIACVKAVMEKLRITSSGNTDAGRGRRW